MINSGVFPMPLMHVFTSIHDQPQQRRRCPRRCPARGPKGQRQEHEKKGKRFQAIAAGEYLPDAPLALGSFGEGVVQLQHVLIHLGLMAPEAIRWRAGVYARNTANAIASLHNKNEDEEADRGKYTEKIKARLLEMLTSKQQQQQQQQQQQEPEAPAKKSVAKELSAPVEPVKNSVYPHIPEQQPDTDEHVYAEISEGPPILRRATAEEQNEMNDTNQAQEIEENVYVQEPPTESVSQSSRDRARELALKWSDQLQALLLMGFKNDHAALLETIEKHHGAMPFVVADLLSA